MDGILKYMQKMYGWRIVEWTALEDGTQRAPVVLALVEVSDGEVPHRFGVISSYATPVTVSEETYQRIAGAVQHSK